MRATKTRVEEQPASSQQHGLARLAPLAITAIAGLLGYGLFYNRGAWLSVIGYSISPAERVLQGEVPYRDFLYNYTPGILWLNAFLMRILGTDLLSVHLGLLAFKLGTLVALFFAGKKLLGNWAALLPVALSLSWIGYKYIFGVFPTQYSMPFVLLGILFMLTYDESETSRWLFLCGVSIGVVFLFKYNVGILLFGCGTLAVAVRQLATTNGPFAKRLVTAVRSSSIYWLGFAVALLPLLFYLLANQALGAMLNHFLHHVSAYSTERKVPLPSLRQLAPVFAGIVVVIAGAWLVLRLAPRWFQAYLIFIFLLAATALLIPGRVYVIKNSAIAWVAYLPLFIFAGIAGFSIWHLRKQKPDAATHEGITSTTRELWWRRNGSTIIVGLFALGAYLEIYPRADYYHVVRALPPTFLLIALLLRRCLPDLRAYLARFISTPHRESLLCAALPLVLLVLVGLINTWLPNIDAQKRFKDRAPLAIERGEGILVPPKQAEFIKELTRLIQTNSAADEPIFSFGQRGAGFYFLAGRKNPTRFVWWRNVGIKREDRESVLRMVSERQAKLILLQDSLKDNRIREIVAANYRVVGWTNGIAVYDRIQESR